ncbi:hypothetical protein PVK06_026364 [Gossypium arboreum]|uniref:Uncharacterized protein n=1 Tax=Gossypium arboreum TaxID=29729 RepID=A0ABR0NYR2_GOSAR|nr:hypothetical protein PVK06_026364 [Gossypium arboreum]
MESHLPANSGHLKLEQTSRFHSEAIQVEEAAEELYKVPHPFRFLSGWPSHSGFGHLVNENWGNDDKLEGSVWSFVKAVKKWNMEVFGNIFKRK